MGIKLDLTGQKFGNLTAIKEVGLNNMGVYNWLCKCDCGNDYIVRCSNLRDGNTKSCRCLNIQALKIVHTKHGQLVGGDKTPEYMAWDNMKRRCYDKNSPHFKNYGGRGIVVCQRWLHSFDNFLSDMGKRPSNAHSLDRHPNNDGNYEHSNCRWATKPEQQRNRRNNRWLEYNGVKMIITDWATRLRVSHVSVRYHLKSKTLAEVIDYYKQKTA